MNTWKHPVIYNKNRDIPWYSHVFLSRSGDIRWQPLAPLGPRVSDFSHVLVGGYQLAVDEAVKQQKSAGAGGWVWTPLKNMSQLGWLETQY